jgi:hypothetical protein
VILVDGDTKLSVVLALHPDVLAYVIELDPHVFRRLEQPLVRRAMAGRLTLARVARMTGKSLSTILLDIHRLLGVELTQDEFARIAKSDGDRARWVPAAPPSLLEHPKPQWAEDLSEHDVHVVQANGDEPEGESRLRLIAQETLRLTEPGDVLLVKHSREPHALYALWDEQGHDRYAEQVAPDEWWIFVRKGREMDQ